jgi:hypothetical protein
VRWWTSGDEGKVGIWVAEVDKKRMKKNRGKMYGRCGEQMRMIRSVQIRHRAKLR